MDSSLSVNHRKTKLKIIKNTRNNTIIQKNCEKISISLDEFLILSICLEGNIKSWKILKNNNKR